MSKVIDGIREKYPVYKDIPDDELALRIGSKYPTYLEQDSDFKQEFSQAVGERSIGMALKGTSEVLKLLTNPAIAEASAMGQEQAQTARLAAGIDTATQTTSKVMNMIKLGAVAAPTPEELQEQKAEIKKREDLQKMGPSAALAAVRHAQTKQAGEGVGVLTTPIAEIFPKITGDQLEKMLGLVSTSMPMAVARERAAGAAPEDRQAEPGMHPERLLTPEARNLVRGVAGVEQSIADQANFFTSPLGIGTLGIGALPAPIAKLVGIAFTAQMASQLPGHSKAINEELSAEEPDFEKIAKTATDAVGALGFTIAGGLHLFEPVIRAARARSAYNKAIKEAFPVAPATAGAVSSQIGMEYMGAGPFLPPTRIPEAPPLPPGAPEGAKTPPEPETPGKPLSASQAVAKLSELGWTPQQIAVLGAAERIKAATEARPAPAESAEPPPAEPADETLASAERTQIKEKGTTVGQTLPDYDPQDIGMKERRAKKIAEGKTPEQAVEELKKESDAVHDVIAELPPESRVRNKDGMLFENVAIAGQKADWVEVNERTGDLIRNSATSSQNLRGGKLERLGKEKGTTDAGTKVQKPEAGALPTEQRKPAEQPATGEAKTGTTLGGGEDQGQKAVTPRETINNVVGADAEAFKKEVGTKQEEHAKKLGASITDQGDVDYLYDQRKNLQQQMESLKTGIKEAQAAGKADQVKSLMNDRANTAFKLQWVNEALEGAVGHPDATKMARTRAMLGEQWQPKFPPREPSFKEFGKDVDGIRKFAEAHDAWKKQVAEWVKNQPEKKPLVFETKNHTYAVTRDPKGGWRYTSFSNRDHAPTMHEEFKTREEAVTEVLRQNEDAKLLDKMPFQVEPLPIRAFPGDEVTWRPPGAEPQVVKFRGYSEEPGQMLIEDPKTGETRTVDSMEVGPKPKPAAEAFQKDIEEKKNQTEASKDLPEVTPAETPETEAKRRAIEDAIFEQEKRIQKEGGKAELARIQNDAIKRGVAESESYLKELEAWKPKGRTANAIRADIRATERNIKALKGAKRGYEKAKAKGPAARTQEKIQDAENKLTELQQELSAAEPQQDKRVGQSMRRFNRETQEGGPDILSHINETGKIMSWSQFVEKAKTKGQEWFNQNKSEYDDIRNVKLPPHINAAIYGGEELPNTVAERMLRDKKISDGTPSALWAEVKQAAKKRTGKSKGETTEEKVLAQEEQAQVWNDATGPAEGRTEIDPSIVAPGERYMVNGQEIKVTGRDPDTGFLQIDGGEKFGQFQVRDNEPFWVDAIIEQAPEGEPDFLPPEETPPTPPAEAPKAELPPPVKDLLDQLGQDQSGQYSPKRTKLYQNLGTEVVPGIRLQDAEEAGRLYEMFQKGQATEAEWNKWVEEAKASNRVTTPATEAPKPKPTGGELFAREEIPFNLEQEGPKGAAPKSKTEGVEQGDLLGGAPPKTEEPGLEKPKVQERPLTPDEQDEFLELSKKYRKNREENGPALTTEETQRYEHLTALAGQKDFGFAEPTGIEAIKGKIKALASQIERLDENAPQGSGKKRQQYVEQREKLHLEMRDLMDQLTEGKGELVYTSEPKESPSGYFTRKEFRVRQLDDEEVQDRWRNPGERMEVFKVAGTRPFVAESRRVDFEDAAGSKVAGKGHWYAEGYGKSRDNAIADARGRKGSSWSKIPEDALTAKPVSPKVESPIPESTKKYRIGNNPTLYTLVERLDQSAAEKANNEQPVRVRNENTGKEEIVLESELQPVKERSAAEKAKQKGKRDLDAELQALGLDPSVFKTKAEKQAAIIRENQKKQGPGTPHITQPPDPKAQIDQLEEAFRNVRGRRVPLAERVKAMFDMGKKLAAAKDKITETIAGLKTTGDYLIGKWEGYKQFDDLLRAKGELSAEIEKNGWRMKHFVRTILDNVQDPMERAAIAKWVDAGGDMEKLIAGYQEAPARFKQHYLDAMDLSGDLLVGAMNIRNYFDARLQEAIDAGVLKDGVEDFIHRIYEKTPTLQKKMLDYMQTGLLRTNPSLAKHRIFDHDWEAEKLGYNVVQDFLPRLVEYEASLTRAIAARKFVRKVVGYKDASGTKIPGMLAADGRPIIDIAGLGIPVADAEGAPEASLIDPSYKAKAKQTTTIDPATGQPVTVEDPLSDRGDYVARNQYSVFRNWKWAVNDTAGNPIYVKGDAIIHPDYVHRFDKLLEPSRVRNARSPVLRYAGRTALSVGSFFKQSMLDLSGFHQVQMAVHGAEHRVYTLPGEVPAGLKALGFEKILSDIDLTDPVIDGLLKGGMTLGGDYHYSREGLAGRSVTRLIPGVSEAMETYHKWLFQDFIPRLKATMGKSAFERNMKAYERDLQSGRRTVQDIYEMTGNQANAAFGELNQITLERSKTMQDALRLIFLAPDFLEARGRFALQALRKGGGDPRTLEYWKRGGPITNNEQRMALAFGAMGLWGFARIANVMLDGQMHNEPENLFSVVYKGRSYGLRTVQGDILHLMTHPVQFWMSRLNPLFGRTLLEAAAGRDYFGRKRSPLEQVWDLVSTLEPASIRHTQEHTIWESLLNAGGVTSRRFSDVDDAFKLAQKWKDKHNVGMKGEFIYDPNKDDLRGLKVALSNGDEARSVKEIQNLIKGGKYSVSKLDSYFERYATLPFAGSAKNDQAFIKTLSDDQKKTVEAAAQHKKAMRKLYLQARGKYNEAIHGPKPKIDESQIDEPTPELAPAQ